MTFLTKPSLVVKKTPLIKGKCDEESIEIRSSNPYWSSEPRLSLSTLVCMTLAAFFVTLVGIATGFMLYRQYIRTTTLHRYQGFCTIPINVKEPALYESEYSVMPLRWSAEPDVRGAVTGGGAGMDEADDLVNSLREELEVREMVEKISVVSNGRSVDFFHDFQVNMTGIVDAERCFTMELDPSTTLTPEVFVLNIEGEAQFDVSRVRSAVRALLPALARAAAAASADVARRCLDKPVYALVKDDDAAIRKREVSVGAPGADYIQFAGQHVQEISILNLGDVLRHEHEQRLAADHN